MLRWPVAFSAVVFATVWCEGLLLKNSYTAGSIEGHVSRPTVWIHAFARSGSSTILSMISENEGVFDETAGKAFSKAFTLFEPCSAEDDLDQELASKGCPGVLRALTHCDFNMINKLHGWSDVHSKRRGADVYDPERARFACAGADLVAFKTISKFFESFDMKEQAFRLLDQEPAMHMIDVIRDPRSIYASWMTTWPFNDTNVGGLGRDINALLGICEVFATNIDAKHDRIHRLKFEDLVKNPLQVTKLTYQQIGLTFGDVQQNWVHKTFNAKDCPGVDQWIAAYSDCHVQSDRSLEKWRDAMTDAEKQAFKNSPSCQKVAKEYNYALE